jgi:hypothetical protein
VHSLYKAEILTVARHYCPDGKF